MSHLFKFLKSAIYRLLPFSPGISGTTLCLFLVFTNYAMAANNYFAADNYFYENDSTHIDRVFVYTSFYTNHFSPQDEHVDDQNMFGMEFRMTDKWMYGLTMFDNSFGQDSEYLYTGYKWSLSDLSTIQNNHHYFKLTGGLLHGYKDEFEDKIPFNGMGVAPAVIPTYGYQYKNYTTEVILGGISVMTVTVGYIF